MLFKLHKIKDYRSKFISNLYRESESENSAPILMKHTSNYFLTQEIWKRIVLHTSDADLLTYDPLVVQVVI